MNNNDSKNIDVDSEKSKKAVNNNKEKDKAKNSNNNKTLISVEDLTNRISKEIYLSKENIYYRREKRKNNFLLIIIIIFLIYLWYCFTYHLGYIRHSGEITNKVSNVFQGNYSVGKEDNNKTSLQIGQSYNIDNPVERRNAGIDNNKSIVNTDNYENATNNKNTVNNNATNNNTHENVANNTTHENTTDGGNTVAPDKENNLKPEEIKEIKLIQESNNKNFNDINNLDIFKNFEYTQRNLIYPGLSGVYDFNVENYSKKDIFYKLTITVNNPHKVNMKYKIKRNGIYILGSDNEYISIDKLSLNDFKLNSRRGDLYTLYWKWEDSPNDNYSTNPITRGDYSVNIKGEV